MATDILNNLKNTPKQKWPDAISFQNEFNDVSPQTAQAFLDYYDTLREGGYEGLIIFGSYGPGGPTDIREWERPHIRKCVQKADGIETHEYWDLTVKHTNTWLAHRHVRMMEMFPWLREKPWFIGEFGSDGVNKGEDTRHRGGWQDQGKLTAPDYIRQIEVYRNGSKDEGIPAPEPNVLAVFLYQQGSPGWKHYETMGTPVAAYMKSTWKQKAGHIRGFVRDDAGKPAQGVQVTIRPGGARAVSDAEGRFWFFSLAEGAYTLHTGRGQSTVRVKGGGVAVARLKS